jgi:hypothetical protein
MNRTTIIHSCLKAKGIFEYAIKEEYLKQAQHTNNAMNTNSKSHPVWAYLMDCIPSLEQIKNEWNKDATTDKERIQFVMDCFHDEYCYADNMKRYGSYQNCFAEWLMGLPSAFNVDFENYRIIEISKEWGSIPQDATENQEYKIISNWFNFIAAKFMQLASKNGIKAY